MSNSEPRSELLGNEPYLSYSYDENDYEKITRATPEQIAQIEQRHDALKAELRNEIPNADAELNTERVTAFLEGYGLTMKPFLAVDAEDVPKLDKYAHMEADGGEVMGAYWETPDFLHVVRDKRLEAVNGVGVTEAILVHEEAHANTAYKTTGFTEFFDFEADQPEVIRLRSGFGVKDGTDAGYGHVFEEGFAELMANRYIKEVLGLPNGFSNWEGVQSLSMGGEIAYKIPRSYFSRSKQGGAGGLATAAHAAFGMELLIAKDPLILDAMIEGRKSVEGLREMARRINALKPGMYSLLAHQPYKDANFMACTRYIIDNLYEGDFDAAAAAVQTPAPELMSA